MNKPLMLLISLLLGPFALLYWVFFWARSWLFDTQPVMKEMRDRALAELGIVLSFASTVAWLLVLL